MLNRKETHLPSEKDIKMIGTPISKTSLEYEFGSSQGMGHQTADGIRESRIREAG